MATSSEPHSPRPDGSCSCCCSCSCSCSCCWSRWSCCRSVRAARLRPVVDSGDWSSVKRCGQHKQEMLILGQFPALEELCLIVCHGCHRVVIPPQGIVKHYGSPGVLSL